MKQLIKFILRLKSFWKLYKDYEYDGDTLRFVISQYRIVLLSRTIPICDITDCARDVINCIDKLYIDLDREANKEKEI